MSMFRIIHVDDIAWKVEERYMVGFYDWDPETASQETDFTFLRNKAHNVRCTSRYLRIAVFWDIKFSISSWSIFQLCILADLSRDENKMLRQLYRKTFAPGRVRVAIMAPTSTSSLRIFVHAVHSVTCDIGLTTRWHEIRKDDDDDETDDDDDDNDDDNCSISISRISCSLTKIWSRFIKCMLSR